MFNRKLLAAVCFAALLPVGAQAQTITTTAPTVPSNAITCALTAGVPGAGPDNISALNACVTAAQAAGAPIAIKAAPVGQCYNYTAPWTINGNLTIYSDGVQGNWPGTGQIDIPAGTPPLLGSVLCPSSNGSDAIDIGGVAAQVNILDGLGILFQVPFGRSATTTGDGINYVNGTNQGLTGSTFNNVIVYGHDGNHYAFNFTNPIYDIFTGIQGHGGGFLKLRGNASGLFYGNSVFLGGFGDLAVNGTANCIDLTANATQTLSLLSFTRTQCNVQNLGLLGVTAPSASQVILNEDQNIHNVRFIAPDLETNVSSTISLGAPAQSNDIDWAGWLQDAATINAADWGVNGILYGPKTVTLNNTTSTGTVANEATAAIPGGTITATSATTFTRYDTLYLGAPVGGTNVTITTPTSLYAQAAIFSNTSITANTGLIASGGSSSLLGTLSLNTSTSGTTTIGNASNTGKTLLAGLSTGTAADVLCLDSTNHVLLQAAGSCTISQRKLKEHINYLTDADGLKDVLALKPAAFNMKPRGNRDPNDTHRQLGFVAEDVATVDPRLALYEPDMKTPKAYRTEAMIAVLVAAVQAQQAEIEALKAHSRRVTPR